MPERERGMKIHDHKEIPVRTAHRDVARLSWSFDPNCNKVSISVVKYLFVTYSPTGRRLYSRLSTSPWLDPHRQWAPQCEFVTCLWLNIKLNVHTASAGDSAPTFHPVFTPVVDNHKEEDVAQPESTTSRCVYYAMYILFRHSATTLILRVAQSTFE